MTESPRDKWEKEEAQLNGSLTALLVLLRLLVCPITPVGPIDLLPSILRYAHPSI